MLRHLLIYSFIVLSLAAGLMTASAQQLPQPVLDRAIQVVQQAIPSLTGSPSGWQYELLPQTDNEALGCPLVGGLLLPAPVTPYRVYLTYGSVQYIVHVSADTNYYTACDEKLFAAAVPTVTPNGNSATAIPQPPDGWSVGSHDGPVQDPYNDGRGVSRCYEVSGTNYCYHYLMTDHSDSASPVLSNFMCVNDETGMQWCYRKNITCYNDDSGVRRCAANESLPANFCTGSRNCSFDTDSLTSATPAATAAPTAQGTIAASSCVLTPASTFSNVRSAPNVDAQLVGSILENSQNPVLGISAGGDWYRIESGWVSNTVSQVSGDCANLRIYTDVEAANTAPTSCPADYAGYMTPRLSIGQATAQVQSGGQPNRLRVEPNTSSEVVGQAQPGRTFNEVLEGPRCSDGVVWWRVSLDGVVGWTAESDYATSSYFIDPVGGSPEPVVAIEGRGFVAFPNGEGNLAFDTVDANGLWTSNRVDNFVRHWDTVNDVQRDSALAHDTPVMDIVMMPGDDGLMTGDSRGTVTIWDVADGTGQEITSIPNVFDPQFGFFASASPVSSHIAVGGCTAGSEIQACIAGKLTIWDISTGQLLFSREGHNNVISEVDYSPDGSLIATASADGVLIWNAETMEIVNSIATNNPVNDIAFSPDGSVIAVAACAESARQDDDTLVCNLGEVRLWNTADMRLAGLLPHPQDALSLDYHADGGMMATGGDDGIVRVWDLEAQEVMRSFSDHEGPVFEVDFSLDGSLLASGSADSTLRLWPIDF